jgi:hypothetical protein
MNRREITGFFLRMGRDTGVEEPIAAAAGIGVVLLLQAELVHGSQEVGVEGVARW